jgi:hypothetical protein
MGKKKHQYGVPSHKHKKSVSELPDTNLVHYMAALISQKASQTETLTQLGKKCWERYSQLVKYAPPILEKLGVLDKLSLNGLNEEDLLARTIEIDVTGMYTESLPGIPAAIQNTLIRDNTLLYLSLFKWAQTGFQTFRMDHALCAGLMSSTFSPEVVAEVHRPYDAFCIDVPDGILYSQEPRGTSPIRKILVSKMGEEGENRGDWSYVAFDTRYMMIWRTSYTAQKMVRDTDPFVDLSGNMEEHDKRLALLIGRLIIGTCCLVTNVREKSASTDETLTPIGNHARYNHAVANGLPFAAAEPVAWKLGTDIQVDLRERIQKYLSGRGTGKSLQVRTLVQGHMRNQPWGPNNSLRRNQWIKPYEKGPENAPMLVRAKILKA